MFREKFEDGVGSFIATSVVTLMSGLGLLLAIFLIHCICRAYDFATSSPVEVKVNGSVIYSGNEASVSTFNYDKRVKVVIRGGFVNLLEKATYLSENVEINPIGGK